MKLNIIVPVYNVQDYIEQMAESLLVQTFQDLRVIIIDDGSTDNTRKLCQELYRDNPRVTLLEQTHKGVSAARNSGLDHLDKDCEYVGFMDGDDAADLEMYHLLIKNLLDTNSEISCCEFGYIRGDGKWERNHDQGLVKIYDAPENVRAYLMGRDYNGSLCNKLFKKALFQDIRFVEEMVYNEDSYVGLLCQMKSKRTCFQAVSYYFVRERPGSALRKTPDLQSVESVIMYQMLVEREVKKYSSSLTNAVYTNQFNSDIGLLRKLAEDKGMKAFKPQVARLRENVRKTYWKSRKNVALGRKMEGLIILGCPWAYPAFVRMCRSLRLFRR